MTQGTGVRDLEMTLQAIHLSPAWVLRTQKPHGFPKYTDDTQMASLPASQGVRVPRGRVP